MQGVDWNGDSFLDLVVSDTYQRTYLLLNDGKSREKPMFTLKTWFDMEKTNHGMMAGGGDWDGDGVADFLHMPFGGNPYKLFRGEASGKGLKFKEGGVNAGTALKVEGDKAFKCAWAWDFSGTAKKRGVIEYVGLTADGKEIGFYEVANGQSRRVATLATSEGDTPLLTLGDLNGDGKMDILFSSGLWNNQKDKTKVYAMYGKVGNTSKK